MEKMWSYDCITYITYFKLQQVLPIIADKTPFFVNAQL